MVTRLRLFNQGQTLGADDERMGKSRGNVQDSEDLIPRSSACRYEGDDQHRDTEAPH